ncbi:molybdopterin converting factor subunit 1 [Bacillaceae bacterium Marseille-Q3522]|nr:molybdopterin converting factor subunit 1 [Bacillaceae bacterium Marseille-Q3522]
MNKILFFAHLKELVGKEFIMIDAKGKTIAELKISLQEMYHKLNLAGVFAAINEEFAQDTEKIQRGDTIAFIPPVSGG